MGTARLIRQKSAMQPHRVPSPNQWFPQGLDTPGVVLVRVEAKRTKYWQGGDEGELQ